MEQLCRLALLSIFAIASLVSCYTPRYVYSPAAQDVPLLVEKNDSRISFNYSTNLTGNKKINGQSVNQYSNGIDLHGAYAVSNHFAIQASYFSRRERNSGDFYTYRDSATIRYQRHLTEVGGGYFTKLNKAGSLLFQGFAGVAKGHFSLNDNGLDGNGQAYSRFHRADVSKFYIQPAIMYQHNKQSAVSVSSRFSFVNYDNIQTDYAANELTNFELETLGDGTIVFWEPAFIHAIGFNNFPVRFEYQLGLSILMSRRFIDARSFNFSFGLQSDIARLFKKKTPEKKD